MEKKKTEEEFNDIPKYKKKKNQKSKSKKRSDHKHEYERIIMSGFIFGYTWADRCKICGRIKGVPYGVGKEGLMKERNHPYICESDYYTAEELHEKYPDTSIYIRKKDENGITSIDDKDVEKIY